MHPIIQNVFSGFLNSQKVAQEYNKANEPSPARKIFEEREKNRIYYRGYTIEPTENGCPYGGYDYYPTDEGRDDDADFDGENYRYCGNVQFTSSIKAAKREIDGIVGLHYAPKRPTEYRGYIIRPEWEYDCGKCDYYFFPEDNEEAGVVMPFSTLQEVKDIINDIRRDNPQMFVVKTHPKDSLGYNLTSFQWRHHAELFADRHNGVIQ